MRVAGKLYTWLMAAVTGVTCVILAFLTAAVFAGVVVRYFGLFDGSLPWIDELSRYLSIWLVFRGLYLMVAAYFISKRRKYAMNVKRASFQELWSAFRSAIPALGMPVIVIGGILGGVFTPTEAGAVAAVYALILAVIYRELKWSAIPSILTEVVVANAAMMIIVAMFALVGWILAIEEVPQTLTSLSVSLTTNGAVFLLIINVVLILLGILIEPLPMEIILAPMLLPLLSEYHIDPVHFFVVFVLNIMIGLLTPPIGMNMFVASYIAKTNIVEFSREVWPFIVALLIVLALVTYIPDLVLFLPNLLMGPGH